MKDMPLEQLGAIFAGCPCTNRETAAEKAAAHAWMDKQRARRPTRARAKFLREVEKMIEDRRRERKKAAVRRTKKH
jgi:acyl-CoA reductase-like NAD-dependent aldehyde dehydrogenase